MVTSPTKVANDMAVRQIGATLNDRKKRDFDQLASSAGMNGLLLVYAFIMVMFRGERFDRFFDRFVVINGIGFLVEGAMLAAWIHRRRSIRRKPAEVRWVMVVGCAILTLVDLIIFSIFIR